MIDTRNQDWQREAIARAINPAWAPIRIRLTSISSSSSSSSSDTAACYEVDGPEDLRRLLDSSGDEVVATVGGFTGILNGASAARTPAVRIERIAALERARAVLAATQLAEELAFTEQQRAEQEAAGVKARNLGRGIAEQVGFARRITPSSAARSIGLAAVLRDRLPQAWKALRAGEVSEDQVQILANRTSHLSDANAMLVDAGVSPRMSGWNKKQTEQAADRAAYEIDPQGFVDRRAGAEKNRRVWIAPSSDCMAKVSALLPMAQAVAVYAQLKKAADGICGVGDEERNRDQVMADTLVTRVTGQEQAHLIPVGITMTITEEALLRNGSEPAFLDGIGPIPAEHARSIIAGEPPGDGAPSPETAASPTGSPVLTPAPVSTPTPSSSSSSASTPSPAPTSTPDSAPTSTPDSSPTSAAPSSIRRLPALPPPTPPEPPGGCDCGGRSGSPDVAAREFKRARAWLTRVLVDPITGVATNLDTRRREFDGTVRRFLVVRDRTCRHPYCGADIRHADHIQQHSKGGPTSVDNGQGLCERGNYAKEMPGWSTRRGRRPGELIVTTPTGHTYRTLPPHQTGMPGTTSRC